MLDDSYKKWVESLATKEYADELVLLAVTIELRVRIVCIPYTPSNAARPWYISTYEPVECALPPQQSIIMGNNDVHYVWLAPTNSCLY